jgi:hypothetical protein
LPPASNPQREDELFVFMTIGRSVCLE